MSFFHQTRMKQSLLSCWRF